MPSLSPASALVKLYFLAGAPWDWTPWQELTGVRHGLFPAMDAHLPAGWSRQNANDVRSFFNAYERIPTEASRDHFAEEKKGNSDYPGRDFWKTWIAKQWKKWPIHNVIVSELKVADIHPQGILLRDGKSHSSWPNANDYLAMVLDPLGFRIFGEEAFPPDSEVLGIDHRNVLKSFIQHSWTRIRTQIQYMRRNSGKLEADAYTALKNLEEGDMTKAKVNAAICAVAKWKTCAELIATAEEARNAEEMLEELKTIMEELGAEIVSKKPANPKVRSKVQARAFQNSATKEDVTDLINIYHEYFDALAEEDEVAFISEPLPPAGSGDDNIERDFGMEVEADMAPLTLVQRLGLIKGQVAMFNMYRHRSGINPWEEEDDFIFAEDLPLPLHLERLSLHWHQLAGVHSIVRSIFTPGPEKDRPTGVLIADSVGLGKTAQSIAFIAEVNLIAYSQRNGHSLPPIINERPYLGEEKILPSLPHLILCPGTLIPQWINELKTLYLPRSIDIFIYDSQTNTEDFWGPSCPLYSSNHALENCIVVASHSVVFNDFRKLHVAVKPGKNARPWIIPRLKKEGNLENTIFAQKFLTIVVDEAHQMRNAGNKHIATLRLLEQARIRLIMTATPLHTAPKDIAFMARLVGIKHFFEEISHDEERDDNSRLRKLKKLDDDGAAFSQERIKIILRHQAHCRGHFLRRSPSSINFSKNPLLDLPPYKEIIGLIQLTKREMDIIEERSEAAKAAVMSASDARMHTKQFYLEYRLAVGYAKDDSSSLLPTFRSLKEWQPRKSTKMDVCANICAHYLTDDRVGDVTFDGGDVSFPDIPGEFLTDPQQSRRIIIYAEFPSMTPLLQNVLSLYGVKNIAISGKIQFKQRDKRIKQFYDDSDPARVLIFSSVGSAGLNLAIADVVILFDQPWSSQDECQIIGRAHRQPQDREVKVIYLHAKDSADPLIWEMARGKSAMFDAFVNKDKSDELRSLLQGHVPDDDESDEVLVGSTARRQRPSAPRPRGKQKQPKGPSSSTAQAQQLKVTRRHGKQKQLEDVSSSTTRPQQPKVPRRRKKPIVVDEDEMLPSPNTPLNEHDNLSHQSDGNTSDRPPSTTPSNVSSAVDYQSDITTSDGDNMNPETWEIHQIRQEDEQVHSDERMSDIPHFEDGITDTRQDDPLDKEMQGADDVDDDGGAGASRSNSSKLHSIRGSQSPPLKRPRKGTIGDEIRASLLRHPQSRLAGKDMNESQQIAPLPAINIRTLRNGPLESPVISANIFLVSQTQPSQVPPPTQEVNPRQDGSRNQSLSARFRKQVSHGKISNTSQQDLQDVPLSTTHQSKPNPFTRKQKRPSTAPGPSTLTPHQASSTSRVPQPPPVAPSRNLQIQRSSSSGSHHTSTASTSSSGIPPRSALVGMRSK
ncbi:hypothetical protein D9756_003663 [Leucocoprinus leucothites]|uniref:Uncharacterized protein n=1 Tax=Leucocoprinus leucothites TaxID=201217 RepID=A0A8H5LJ55_9AGAR|nr:hypothetical protein D9756_003663 [Leucoagaricus leucothites]